MYINYIGDRQDLGFTCLKDITHKKQINIIFKNRALYITFTILLNYNLYNRELIYPSYLDKTTHEIQILSSNKESHTTQNQLINKLRGGSSSKKIEESLKESMRFNKLQKNLVSKSVDSKSFTNKSFNKIVIEVMNKIEPVLGDPKF